MIVGASVFVVASLGPAAVQSLRPDAGQWTDFFQDWASARNVLSGLPAYAPHEDSVRRYLGDDPVGSESQLMRVSKVIRHNAHPPASVLLALPLASFEYDRAVLIWNLVSLAALVASIWIVQQQLGLMKSAWQGFGFVAALLVCGPLWKQTHLAQLNLLLLLLLCGVWAAERTGRPRIGGGLLGAAVAIKLFPGFLLAYYAIRRQWQLVAWAVAAFTACSVLAVLVLGGESFLHYGRVVLPSMDLYRSAWNNASLNGLCSKLFNPSMSNVPFLYVEPLAPSRAAALISTTASCVVITLVVALSARAATTRGEKDRAYGLAVIGMLLVSPITWDHYLLLLLLPLACFASEFAQLRWWKRVALAVAIVGVCIPPLPLYGWLLKGATGAPPTPLVTVTLLSYQCYALLALFFVGAAPLWHSLSLRERHAAQTPAQPMNSVLGQVIRKA